MSKTRIIGPRNIPIVQYIVPFYKEKFVSPDQVMRWFRQYNQFQLRTNPKKLRLENYVNAYYSPDTLSSGITLVGSGLAGNYLKYFKWLNVRNRLVIELGRRTDTGWSFGELLEQKNCDHITQDQLQEVCSSLNNQKVELYDLSNHRHNFKEAPRLSLVNSIEVHDFQPPYASLDVSCSGGLRVLNLVLKINELLDCPISLLDADRYDVEGYTREHCLTKTDIYWEYILESRSRHYMKLFGLLKEHQFREQLIGPTHRRYLLYM